MPDIKLPNKCVFCSHRGGLSRTHIWPDWLHRMLLPGDAHKIDLTKGNAHRAGHTRQGSIFTQKPRLCCEACNTGWMHDFEDEMLKFAGPLFTDKSRPLTLSAEQRRVLAVWVSLVTVLAERIDRSRSSVCINEEERYYIRERLMPPPNWRIVACSLDGGEWRAKYRHHSSYVGSFSSPFDYHMAVGRGMANNSQISSFGMGYIFVQVFSCPNDPLLSDFAVSAKARGFEQIWPPPMRFWPLPQRLAKFPTKLILDDQEAEEAADAFHTRMEFLMKPPIAQRYVR